MVSHMGLMELPYMVHHCLQTVEEAEAGPPDNIQLPRWTSPVQKFNLAEHNASSIGGSRTQTTWFPRSTERRYGGKAIAASPSFGSPLSFSESSHSESTSKMSLSFPNRNFTTRRSCMSKAVYPLVFRNPVSDCEPFGDAEISSIGRLTPGEDGISPAHWPDNNLMTEHKFHKTLVELQRLETSPDPGASSRREGFRWSNASSYDLGFDGDRFDIAEHVVAESIRSPLGPAGDQKCGVCWKLLCQKSPQSSYRIMRGGDMPIAGVLSCSHVFHADCLEQVTPKTHIHDPPCPLCLKTIGEVEESSSVSEPLQMALRSVRRSKGLVVSEDKGNQSSDEVHFRDRLRRNWSQEAPRGKDSSYSIKNRLKKHFTFKGKMGKDIFRAKVFQRVGSSSSSREPVEHELSFR